MDKTIYQVPKDQCTGCGACYNKCPVNAITMETDVEGFLFPVVDLQKCTNCGRCLKNCPVIGPKYENIPEPKCYAVMASDEIREKSSSGGVFTLLAEWMLEQGGVVCGAAYADDYYSVMHVIVDSREELCRLRGSKYVQSNTGLIYTAVKEYLDKGTPVLFTGTPCQIAAMISFLGKPYDNLYTLDLVCHGVPSPEVYRKFIKEQEEKFGSKVVRVAFRDKSVVQWNHCIKIEFLNGKIYQKKKNECLYLKSYLRLLNVRKSCGSCQFAQIPRQGDMTIADFWDIDQFNSKYDDRKGTSLILVNNDKGKRMQKNLIEKSVLFEEAPLEHAIKYNAQIKYSSVLHPRRTRFYDLLNTYNYSFEKAADYGLNRRFDIGYVGWWYGANYGSVMTNYALNRVLKDMGKTVLMLEWPVLDGIVPGKKPNSRTRRFVNHFYEQSLFYRIEDYSKFNYHCETFVVGSDQLWNWWSNRDVGTYHFFLDFADDKHKKIAYATSFGHEEVYYPEEMRLKISYLLSRFDAISVRENSAVTVCKRDFNVDAVQTVDPVFLCSMEDYENAIALSQVKIEEPYILAYILNPTEDKMESIRYVAQQMNLPYHVILDGQGDFEELKQLANDPNVLENVEVADWLCYFKNATYVITDSYHGFCYSIIFGHSMSVFLNKLRGLARFNSLAQITGLQERLIYSKQELIETTPWKKSIDFAQIWERMRPQIEFSRQWLKESLEMDKLPPTTKELELKQLLELQEKQMQLVNQITDMETKKNASDIKLNNSLSYKFKELVRPYYYKIRQVLRSIKWHMLHK